MAQRLQEEYDREDEALREERRALEQGERGGAEMVPQRVLSPVAPEPAAFALVPARAPAVPSPRPATLTRTPRAQVAPVSGRWQWCDDGDQWKAYPEPAATQLEAAYQTGGRRVDVDAERYVDLTAMVQRRLDDPRRRRRVRRSSGM
eukprot:COSAG04_NODE_1137_length_8116_cov_3.481976_2_plen_147_part_00